jgi:tetratricopeptide (TPR) repeat protein/TolB-like protein
MKTRWLTTHYLWHSLRALGPRPTLAVLPLVVAAGPEEQWLGPGLAAAVEHALRSLPSVTVLNRTDAHWVLSRLGARHRPPRPMDAARQAGDLLGAEVVLDGDVIVEARETRIALHLLDVAEGRVTSLPEFRGPEALLLVPAVIAQAVDALGVSVSRAASRRLVALPTSSQAAFAACGRALQWDRTPATFERAEAEYRQALELDPAYTGARKNLADLFLAAGSLEEAVDHYEQALRDQPDYAMAHNNLAVAYRRQGRLEEAMCAFAAVIHLNTDGLAMAYAHNNLGNVYRQQGQDQRAAEEYRAALQWLPRYAMARANLGVIARRRGAEEEARRHFEEAVALGNELLAVAFAYRQLADLYADRGEWEQSVVACREALAVHPNDARACLALGDSLRALGRISEARDAYRAVLTLDSRPRLRADARLRLGDLYRTQHHLSEARREYRAALRLQPEDEAARKRLAEVENDA